MCGLFESISYKGTEKVGKEGILYILILGTALVITVPELMLLYLLPQNLIRWITILCSFYVFAICLIYLNSKGYTRVASYIFITYLFILIFSLAATAGGLRAIAIHYIPLVVLITGVLLGWKVGLLSGLFSSIIGFGLILAEYNGILPKNTVIHTPFSIWINIIIIIGTISYIQYISMAKLDMSRQNVQQEIVLRKKTEEDLKNSITLRNRVFEGSSIPIVIMDIETYKIVDCNQAAVHIYGFTSKEEVLRQSIGEASATTQYDGTLSVEKAKYYIEKAMVQGSVVFEWKHRKPNGGFWDAEVHLIKFESNQRQLLQFTLFDITGRKNAESSLSKSESRLKSISNNFKAGMIYQVIISPGGKRKFTYLSDSVNQLYGITPEEGMADPSLIYCRIHDDDMIELAKTEDKAIREFSIFRAEVRVRNMSGEIRWSSFVSTPKRLEDGSICFDGIEFIITERKLAEDALNKSEASFRSLFENASIGYVQTAPDGKLLRVNKALADMLGYTVEELHLMNFRDITHPDDLSKSNANIKFQLSGHDDTLQFEKRFLHRNATVIWTFLSSTLLRDNKNTPLYFITSIIDITNKKRTEEKLKKHMDELVAWHKITIGRESRVLELKKEINDLLAEHGMQSRYKVIDNINDNHQT